MQARTMQAYVNNTLVRNFLYEVVTSSDLDAFLYNKNNGFERVRGASRYHEVVTSSDLDHFCTIKTMVLRESEVRRGISRSRPRATSMTFVQ